MSRRRAGLSHNGKLVLFCACAVVSALSVMIMLRLAVVLGPELYYGGFDGLWDAIVFQGVGLDKMRIDDDKRLVLTASRAEQRAVVAQFAALWLVVLAVTVGGVWGLLRTSKELFRNTDIESAHSQPHTVAPTHTAKPEPDSPE